MTYFLRKNLQKTSVGNFAAGVFACVIIFAMAFGARAQELEPRNYAYVPKNLNVASFSYSLSYGHVVTDATSPVQNLNLTTHTFIASYIRTFGVFGKLNKVQLNIPFSLMYGSAKLAGNDTAGNRIGFADTRLKWTINLFGSPALSAKDFVKYHSESVLGISLTLGIPTGLYYKDKLINIGSNRWSFKPEIGFSQKLSQFYFEVYSGVWFFTENKEYLKKNTLRQDPIFSCQGHVNYTFPSQMWIALNISYYSGGRTIVNDKYEANFQSNWRLGGTLSYPISKSSSIRLLVNTGVVTRVGQSFTTGTIGYQYTWF